MELDDGYHTKNHYLVNADEAATAVHTATNMSFLWGPSLYPSCQDIGCEVNYFFGSIEGGFIWKKNN